MFQSVIKLFQIYKFFDCKYQLAYQRSRSSNKGRLRPDRSDSIHSSSRPVRVQLAAQLFWNPRIQDYKPVDESIASWANNGLLMRNNELRPPGLTPLPDTNKAAEEKKVTTSRMIDHTVMAVEGGKDVAMATITHLGGYQPNLSHGQGSGRGISFKPQSSTKSVCHRCGMGNHWAKI
uniref:Uncharacterized protein n=1 Tax=Brassica oleracea var. oleracea TaxID=109376 RepID=A0A0D3CNZ6_BRAOL